MGGSLNSWEPPPSPRLNTAPHGLACTPGCAELSRADSSSSRRRCVSCQCRPELHWFRYHTVASSKQRWSRQRRWSRRRRSTGLLASSPRSTILTARPRRPAAAPPRAGLLLLYDRPTAAQLNQGGDAHDGPADRLGQQHRLFVSCRSCRLSRRRAQVVLRLGWATGARPVRRPRPGIFTGHGKRDKPSRATSAGRRCYVEGSPIDTASGLPTSVRRMTARRVAATSGVLRPDLQPDEVDDGFGQALGHLVHELASVLARHFAQLRAEHDGGNECLQLLAWFQPE